MLLAFALDERRQRATLSKDASTDDVFAAAARLYALDDADAIDLLVRGTRLPRGVRLRYTALAKAPNEQILVVPRA